MTTYAVTLANWDDPSFWSSISENAGGHTLDFSALPSNFTIDVDKDTGRITIDDGTSSFVVGEAGFAGGSDATLGGSTLWDFFDTLSFGDGNQTIRGDANAENITTGAGTDLIEAGGGNDTVDAGSGSDTIDGGAGDDDIQGGDGTDSIQGGDGDDTIDGGDRTDTVFGGNGNDSITDTGGSTSDDTLYGNGGDDTIDGGQREDLIDGGTGEDSLIGGEGADTIIGGEGADTIAGGDDADTIHGDFADTGTSYYVTSTGELYQYDPDTGTETLLQSGLQSYGDIAVGDDGTIYGVPFLSSGGQPFGVYTIDPDTGTETLVYSLTDTGESHPSLAIDPGGNLYLSFDNEGTIHRLEPDGLGGFADAGSVVTPPDRVTDLAFLDDTTVWTAINGQIVQYDVDSAGNFTNETNLGDVNPGQTDIWGLTVGENGLVYAYEGSGEVWSADPTSLPLTWTAEPNATSGTGQIWGASGVAGGADSIDGGNGADTIFAGDGNDTVQGGAGNDMIDGGAGDDRLSNGFGDDTVFGGTGNDTLVGGEDNDILSGQDGDDRFFFDHLTGADTIIGGDEGGDTDRIDFVDTTVGAVNVVFDGNESGSYSVSGSSSNGEFTQIEEVYGSENDDTLDASATDDGTVLYGQGGDDQITGGNGADTLNGGLGNDTITGGDGNDSINSGDNDDSVAGGSGDDQISAAGGNDTVSGGQGADSIIAGAGDDEVTGGDGNDTLQGSSGNDTLDGGADDDEIFGGQDEDDLSGGTGNDTILGGTGNDIIAGDEGADDLRGQDGNDTITVAEGDTASGGDGDDTFILSDLGEAGSSTIDIVGGETGETNGDTLRLTSDISRDDITFSNTDDDAGGLSGSFTMADGTTVTFSEIENIICFTPGAMILTSHGERAVETLRVGDLVVTRDQGLRPIRWIGKRTVAGTGRFAPIRIGAKALDPTRQGLLVSPQHRILYTGYRAELLFGDSEVLVPAKHLVDGMDVVQEECDQVTYIHLMFDHHEVIYADGIATESFHAGDVGLGAVGAAGREELFTLFPELRTAPGTHLDTARLCLKKHEAALLINDEIDIGHA